MRNGKARAGQELGRILRLGAVGGMTDPHLLEQFLTGDEESATAAFEAIVGRHGPMVLRTCRTVLRDPHAAEDAFQATFLVLARKAGTLGAPGLLGNWLYGVALRVSRKSRTAKERRRLCEIEVARNRPVATKEPLSDDGMKQVLYEEVERLPRSFRTAVVCCYLEGMPQAQAARELGLAESTLRGRLARARNLLGRRLTGRGIALATGIVAFDGLKNTAADRLSASAVHATGRAALLFVNRGHAMQGIVSATSHSIARGVLDTMWCNSLKAIGAAVAAAALAAGGAALMTQQSADAQSQAIPSAPRSAPETPGWPLSPGRDPASQQLGFVLAQTPERIAEPGRRVAIDPDLVKSTSGRVVRAVPISSDCMILAYMPAWDHGNIETFAMANNDGGVRVLIKWPEIPREEATSPKRQFMIALYSHKTTSNPPAGPIHAFEILEDWPERTSWQTQPRHDPEPGGTYKFEPGEGWKLFDITSLVRHQAQAGRSNHGVLLRFLNEDFPGAKTTWSGYDLVSRERTGELATRRPLLLVVEAAKQ
jgi:RNA polymerase sigma factor (sigma-70 family)